MEVLSPSAATITPHIFPRKAHNRKPQNITINIKFCNPPNKRNHLHLSFSSSFIYFICFSYTPSATLTSTTKTFLTSSDNHHWMVLMEAPQQGVNSKPEVIDYYVNTLARVLGSEKDAQSVYIMHLVIPPSVFAVTLTKILPASSSVYLRFYRLGPTRMIVLLKRHTAH